MVKEIIALIFVFGGLGTVLWLCIDLAQFTTSRKVWKEFCPECPIISFEKFRTLYEIDKSRWTLDRDYVVFTDNNNHHTSLGMTYRDYLKYKRYYKYLNKKHATIDTESKQKDFEDTLDKYLESKISKIQNDLRKNTEELKRKTKDYKSDFDCINECFNTKYPDLTLEIGLDVANKYDVQIKDTENGKIMYVYADCIPIDQIEEIRKQNYAVGMYRFINKTEGDKK